MSKDNSHTNMVIWLTAPGPMQGDGERWLHLLSMACKLIHTHAMHKHNNKF